MAFSTLSSWWSSIRQSIGMAVELIEELIRHRYFQSLRELDWSRYQLGPILISSILINLLELSSPLYINIVYTSILPTSSTSSLWVLTVGVVVLMLLSGWLKTVRLTLTGADGARIEHGRRLMALSHFSQMRLDDYLRTPPTTHAERLNSINLLRDESSLQALNTAIDLAFSLIFVLVLFLIAGSVGFIAVLAIVVYLLRSLSFARQYEEISRRNDGLELDRLNYQNRLMDAINLIKSNGLGRQFLVGNEHRQEELAWQRMQSNQFNGRYQAFGSLMSQLTMAAIITWGAFLVIRGDLLSGALAAALLLGGKILSPWQQAMGLWNSYRRLTHARQEFDLLMATPTESIGGNEELNLEKSLQLEVEGHVLEPILIGSSVLLKDSSFGGDVRHLFLAMIQVETFLNLKVDTIPIASFRRDSLRNEIVYVDPSMEFFEGTLLQNITSFQPTRYRRRALFWSYLIGLDAKVRSLPDGYNTTIGTSMPSGLSSDALHLFQLVRALATDPKVVMIDLSDCSYGKQFIDGLERVLKRTKGHTTVLLNGVGNVLVSISDQQIQLPIRLPEVIA
ncbi:ABC transporter transmembrane domain-containing protein [Synechococcus sp. CBW1002]|uniref:ABC transporter transmembrane domain-containing protein n=2 Tax=Synechococcus TaxID=1129 RepID=UPI001E28E188|nr:ABC transporter transmembrane domain-containing protein [Synechococcus sp. CBW1002]